MGNLLSIAFNLSCAFAPNTGALIGFRFLCKTLFSFVMGDFPVLTCAGLWACLIGGLSGGAPIAIGGGTVSDLFAPRERAIAMAMYNLGPLLGAYHTFIKLSKR